MPLQIDEKALYKIQELRPSPDACLRIEVRGGGCSGLVYDIHWVESPEPDDRIVVKDRMIVFVEERSALFLEGFVLSYEESLTSAGFKLINDKIQTCGCGKSFSL